MGPQTDLSLVRPQVVAKGLDHMISSDSNVSRAGLHHPQEGGEYTAHCSDLTTFTVLC